MFPASTWIHSERVSCPSFMQIYLKSRFKEGNKKILAADNRAASIISITLYSLLMRSKVLLLYFLKDTVLIDM